MTQPTIPDWIGAISSALGIPLIIWGILKIFRKDKNQERKLNSLEQLAASQTDILNKMTDEINELAKQTSEYQYQSSLMEESNRLISKQIEIQNDIFLHNKVTEARKLELQEIEQLAKTKPHFTFNAGSSNSSQITIKLKNKGAPAKNIRIEKVSGEFIHFRKLNPETEVDNGKIIEINGSINSNSAGFNNLQRSYELVLSYEDSAGHTYKQQIVNNRVSNPVRNED